MIDVTVYNIYILGVCDNELFIIAIMHLIITIITILYYTCKYQLDTVNISKNLSLYHSLCNCACFIAKSESQYHDKKFVRIVHKNI